MVFHCYFHFLFFRYIYIFFQIIFIMVYYIEYSSLCHFFHFSEESNSYFCRIKCSGCYCQCKERISQEIGVTQWRRHQLTTLVSHSYAIKLQILPPIHFYGLMSLYILDISCQISQLSPRTNHCQLSYLGSMSRMLLPTLCLANFHLSFRAFSVRLFLFHLLQRKLHCLVIICCQMFSNEAVS